MAEQNGNLLTIKNLSIKVGQQQLIKDYNLELSEGQCKGISAPTGTGKTTLFNSIAGLLPQKAFSISGEIIKCPDLKIAYAFQEPRLINGINVIENVMLPLNNLLDKERSVSIARVWLGKLNLLNKAYEAPNMLSGGEQQRANIARAFAYSQVLYSQKKAPCLLLLDEPFASQDEQNALNINSLIKEELLLPKTAALVISHDKSLLTDF